MSSRFAGLAHLAFAAAFAVPTASAPSADDPAIAKIVVSQAGQAVDGVGIVSAIGTVAVNNHGDTLIEVFTHNAQAPHAVAGVALLRNGLVLLQHGSALDAPTGALLDSVDSVALNDAGDSAITFFLDGTTGKSDDSGVYFNTSLVVQEGDFAAAAGFGPMTPFTEFLDTKLNESGTILLIGTCDPPPSRLLALRPSAEVTYDQFIMKLDRMNNQTLVLLANGPVPGHPDLRSSIFGTGPHQSDINDAGSMLYFVDSGPLGSGNGVILLDSTTVAREGAPSPLAGRSWSPSAGFSVCRMSLNNDGDVVYSGGLTGDTTTNSLVVKNGAKFVQEGDSIPGIAGFKLKNFGSGPILIADRGAPDADPDVLWFGEWNAPSYKNKGLFLDDLLLLQEGVSDVGGTIIDRIYGLTEGYAMSDNGRYVLVKVDLVGLIPIRTLLLLDLGPWESLGNALAGSTKPKLRGFGQATPGSPTTLRLSNGRPGSTGWMALGLSQVDLPFLGGVLVPSPDRVLFGLPVDADGVHEFKFTWPDFVPPGGQIFAQMWVFDAAAPSGFSASNGVVGTRP